MDSLWNNEDAQAYRDDPLALCIYMSRLLGQEPALILHGGGNTSVKAEVQNLFGETEAVLHIKGSGWDLETITAAGFATMKLEVLKRMILLDSITDIEMVNTQRCALLNPQAPDPSIESLLHAMIPFRYVAHTHADAVLTLTNTDKGEERIQAIYGDRVVIVPHVMPGFRLAKKVQTFTQGLDWSTIEGIILMNHGVFTFHDEAQACYEQMVYLASEAEAYLFQEGAWDVVATARGTEDLKKMAQLRHAVSQVQGCAVLGKFESGPEACGFSQLPKVAALATQGPLTPDHVIRTKRIPVVIQGDVSHAIEHYSQAYLEYFAKHTDGSRTCLDSAPRWAIWPAVGIVAFGQDVKATQIVSDIAHHTLWAIQRSEALGGWKTLSEEEIFEIEYWELEQAKLKKIKGSKELQGKIALVTGAASGIGKACVEELAAKGAAVVGVDINPAVKELCQQPGQFGIVCDLTQQEQLTQAVSATIRQFGGLDILVSNAGIFPASQTIEEMDVALWNESLAINLTSHQCLLQACVPYLKWGIEPTVVIVASKNVPAPGPGAAAYSVAKAGLTQLARVAALELASSGIRVNILHPNAIFDTAIWTKEVLEKRAKHYQMTVADYKTNNLLHVEIQAKDVATLVCAMAGPVFAKTTGAQIPIDGGNERVV